MATMVLGSWVGYAALVLIPTLGLLVVIVVKTALFRRNMPDEAKTEEILAEIQAMKARGVVYGERLQWLREQGLRRGVAEYLLAEAETRADEDTSVEAGNPSSSEG